MAPVKTHNLSLTWRLKSKYTNWTLRWFQSSKQILFHFCNNLKITHGSTESIFGYFFLSRATLSLKSSGSSLSSLNWSGIRPKSSVKEFIHLCLSWKWLELSHLEASFPNIGWGSDASILVRYCFFWVTLIGGKPVKSETRKFMRISSQFEYWLTRSSDDFGIWWNRWR